MKAGLVTVLLLILTGTLSGLLSGCGQKGPLYRDSPAETSAEQESRREQDSNG